MTRTWRVGVTFACAILLSAGLLSAGGTQSFRQTTAKDFEEGEATASVILPTGEVVPGLKATRVPLEAAFVWCSATSPDGKTAYFGTGDQGRVFAVKLRDGNTAPAPARLADLDVPWVTSLAVRPDGTLAGRLHPGRPRVSSSIPAKGESRQLAKLPAEHVWSLAHDPQDRHHLRRHRRRRARCSPSTPRAAVKQVWDSGDKQVVSLAVVRRRRAVRRHLQRGRALPGRGRRPGRSPCTTSRPTRCGPSCASATPPTSRSTTSSASAATRPSTGTSTTTTTIASSAAAGGGRQGDAHLPGRRGQHRRRAQRGAGRRRRGGRGAVYRLDDGGRHRAGVRAVRRLPDRAAGRTGRRRCWPPPAPRARSTACCPTARSPWPPTCRNGRR